MDQKYILFVCGHNAGRSQMAEAYFNHVNRNPNYRAVSCGTCPAEFINPVCKDALEERNICTDYLVPKKITPVLEARAQKIITMGCGVECSVFSGNIPVEDWDLSDPHGKGRDFIEVVFGEIQEKVDSLLLKRTNPSEDKNFEIIPKTPVFDI